MPKLIHSKDLFDAFFTEFINPDTGFINAYGLTRLEALFDNRLTFTIRTAAGLIASGVSSNGSMQIEIDCERGSYSSKNCLVDANPLAGLDGLSLWLQTIKAHLGPESETTCLLFIVGTHLDKVLSGESGSRRDRIDALLDTLQIQIPWEYHEISLYPIKGRSELMPGLDNLHACIIERTQGLSHMGEQLPKTYLVIADAIHRLSILRKASKQG
jgi:hypothetical protein